MSRKQYIPHGSSHEKKLTRKERKQQAKDNPIVQTEQPMMVSAPTEEDRKQLRKYTILGVAALVLLMALMYYIFISSVG